MNNLINFDDFNHLDIRIGTIISANFFEKAIKPAYQLIIDFGLLGKLNSSAQITELYQPENLIGKQVVVVVNIGKIKIENFVSQCLVLGVSTSEGISLLKTDLKIINGSTVV
jgi:tRNA-binding protein|tara:strand:+ start:36568 stop:36903 length:336 start_codon:yes stop_codon:yes gene_type:complete